MSYTSIKANKSLRNCAWYFELLSYLIEKLCVNAMIENIIQARPVTKLYIINIVSSQMIAQMHIDLLHPPDSKDGMRFLNKQVVYKVHIKRLASESRFQT